MHGLVIAGHGSHYDARTALPVWNAVDKIRQTGLFDEVTAAFWKEQPSLGTVLEGLLSNEITIVPFFTSEGYFSRKVLPAELNPRPSQQVNITSAIGSDAYFSEIVLARLAKAIGNYPPSEVAVIIVGHGTDLDKNSASTTEMQVSFLQQRMDFRRVGAAYLDQGPFIHDIYKDYDAPVLVVVPFFIAEGLHTQTDIPEALELSSPFYEPQFVDNRLLIYTPPVGLEADLYKVVLSLANQNPDTPLAFSSWCHFPMADILLQAEEIIGDLFISENDTRHLMDKNVPAEHLTVLSSPFELRNFIRYDANGSYRSLASARNLRTGWRIHHKIASPMEIVSTIYPHWAAQSTPRSIYQVAHRQQGKYQSVAHVSTQKINECVQLVCSGCVKKPLWHSLQDDRAVLSCLEPCSIWLEEAIR